MGLLKARIVMEWQYEVEPGKNGYAECQTLIQCAKLDQTLIEEDPVDFIGNLSPADWWEVSVTPAE